jgi:hypothetical protein
MIIAVPAAETGPANVPKATTPGGVLPGGTVVPPNGVAWLSVS